MPKYEIDHPSFSAKNLDYYIREEVIGYLPSSFLHAHHAVTVAIVIGLMQDDFIHLDLKKKKGKLL